MLLESQTRNGSSGRGGGGGGGEDTREQAGGSKGSAGAIMLRGSIFIILNRGGHIDQGQKRNENKKET